MFSVHWRDGWRLGLDRFKFRLMRVVAVGTKIVSSFPGAGKVARPFPVNTRLPVSVDIPVTFAAKPVTLVEVDQLCIIEAKFITISRIMAIEAPPHGFRMMQFDLRMFLFELSLLPVDLHGGMTVAARENSFGKRWWRDGELFAECRGRSCKKSPE
jgi:hypothetical protein